MLTFPGFSYNGTNGAGFLEAFQPRIANAQKSKWEVLDNVSLPLFPVTHLTITGIPWTRRHLLKRQCVSLPH